MYVCPADTVAAPPEVVWQLLMQPETYGAWADAPVIAVDPPGPTQKGQVIRFGTSILGIRLETRFVVERVDSATHDLELEGSFPFGLTMHEHITVRQAASDSGISGLQQHSVVRFG